MYICIMELERVISVNKEDIKERVLSSIVIFTPEEAAERIAEFVIGTVDNIYKSCENQMLIHEIGLNEIHRN